MTFLSSIQMLRQQQASQPGEPDDSSAYQDGHQPVAVFGWVVSLPSFWHRVFQSVGFKAKTARHEGIDTERLRQSHPVQGRRWTRLHATKHAVIAIVPAAIAYALVSFALGSAAYAWPSVGGLTHTSFSDNSVLATDGLKCEISTTHSIHFDVSVAIQIATHHCSINRTCELRMPILYGSVKQDLLPSINHASITNNGLHRGIDWHAGPDDKVDPLKSRIVVDLEERNIGLLLVKIDQLEININLNAYRWHWRVICIDHIKNKTVGYINYIAVNMGLRCHGAAASAMKDTKIEHPRPLTLIGFDSRFGGQARSFQSFLGIDARFSRLVARQRNSIFGSLSRSSVGAQCGENCESPKQNQNYLSDCQSDLPFSRCSLPFASTGRAQLGIQILAFIVAAFIFATVGGVFFGRAYGSRWKSMICIATAYGIASFVCGCFLVWLFLRDTQTVYSQKNDSGRKISYMPFERTTWHPISANAARKNVAVNAPRASLLVTPAFVSRPPGFLLPFRSLGPFLDKARPERPMPSQAAAGSLRGA